MTVVILFGDTVTYSNPSLVVVIVVNPAGKIDALICASTISGINPLWVVTPVKPVTCTFVCAVSNSNVNTVAPATPDSLMSLMPLLLVSLNTSMIIVPWSGGVTGLSAKFTVVVLPWPRVW